MAKSVFFHVDLDAFFASVEQLDNPAYRGKPVIVGGQGRRAVVSTCSYEARVYGIHSAMPMFKARKLCPHGIFLPVRMQRYHEKSQEVMGIFRTFTPEVQQLSIDEAFLDMSGTEALFGKPIEAAHLLKQTIKERTGLCVSIGAASNKYIAKIASGKSKPDGLLAVPHSGEARFMASLTLKEIWGIGRKSLEKLSDAGLHTVAAVLSAQESSLQRILGNAGGTFLYNVVRGNSAQLFNEIRKTKTISTERTFEYDIRHEHDIADILFQLSAELMTRILHEHIIACTVYIKIRYSDFSTVSAQQTGSLINDSVDLYQRAHKLFFSRFDSQRAVRLIGIGVADNSKDAKFRQPEFAFSEKTIKTRKAEEAVRNIIDKNQGITITHARLLTPYQHN